MSEYCTRDDIEHLFGGQNVKKWADLDNDADSVKIAARIERAIAFASSHIDDRLRGGPYTLPVAGSPPTLVNLAAMLAGVWLYESRGTEDWDEATGKPQHRLRWFSDRADRILRDLRSGVIRLDAARLGVSATAPIVVND